MLQNLSKKSFFENKLKIENVGFLVVYKRKKIAYKIYPTVVVVVVYFIDTLSQRFYIGTWTCVNYDYVQMWQNENQTFVIESLSLFRINHKCEIEFELTNKMRADKDHEMLMFEEIWKLD